MSKEIIEQKKAEKAHNRREKILKLKRVAALSWLELGKQLFLVEKNKDYIGLGFESMNAYLLAPESVGGIDLTKTWALDFKCNYEKFVNELGRPGDHIALLEPSKLRYIRPIVDNKNVEEWLNKAKSLSRSDLIEEIKELNPPTPLQPIKGKYNVFIIDPPWPYETQYDEDSRRVASPYEEKSIEELKEWGIKEFKKSAHKDSAMWLWTTHKFIKDALQLLEDWGWNYKLTLVWDKQKMGMGTWLRCQTEFCLLGAKGDYHKYWNLETERDIISASRREHSRKPDEFYEMVKRLCPQGNKIDIFSREKREGFEQYGNETEKF